MKAVLFDRFGPPDVLRFDEVPDPIPAAGRVLVRLAAAGLNMSDIYRRQGRYAVQGSAPWIPGYEGAGTVEATGPDVTCFKPGDRVAFADVPRAAAELVLAAEELLVPVPATLSLETAAAVMLQGLTAQYLCHDSYDAGEGEAAVVLAAAGGVGLLLTQMLAAKGAQVLGVASSADKRAAAGSAGASATTGYDEWAARARQLKDGRGPDVVFDSLGSTLETSLRTVRVGGTVVFFGFSDGDPAPVDPRLLIERSVTLTGGDLWNVLDSADTRRSRAARLFDALRDGKVHATIAGSVPMRQADAAHAALESRAVIGKLLLIP